MKKEELLKGVQEQVDFWYDLARDIYPKFRLQYNEGEISDPEVDLKVKGKCAGKSFLNINKLSFNEILLRENFKEFCNRTIPHEVAHIVAYMVKGESGHGRGWKEVMRAFGVESSRCHSYDTTNSTVRTVTAKYKYKCNCSEHLFTKIRHKRSQDFIQRKPSDSYKYSCTICKSGFMYIPD